MYILLQGNLQHLQYGLYAPSELFLTILYNNLFLLMTIRQIITNSIFIEVI